MTRPDLKVQENAIAAKPPDPPMPVTDRLIAEDFWRAVADGDPLALMDLDTLDDAAMAIASYHAMRSPRDLSEHVSAAWLLGLDVDTPDPDQGNTTLAERIAAYHLASLADRPRQLATPFLDAWQQNPTPVGTPEWRCAAWEQSALNAEALCLHVSADSDLATARAIATEAGLMKPVRAVPQDDPRRPWKGPRMRVVGPSVRSPLPGPSHG